MDKIRDSYFFLDYYRLHKYGIENNIWKRNRNFINRESEYCYSRNKTGYKSYIQRCVKPILEDIFDNDIIFKPKNFFGYEIGRKSYNVDCIKTLEKEEDYINLIICLFLCFGYYEDLVAEYIRKIKNNKSNGIKVKNFSGGLRIKLDDRRSNGYKIINITKDIKSTRSKIVKEAQKREEIVKNLLVQALSPLKKNKIGLPIALRTNHEVFNKKGFLVKELLEDNRHNINYILNIDGDEIKTTGECFYFLNGPRNRGSIDAETEKKEKARQKIIDYVDKEYNQLSIENWQKLRLGQKALIVMAINRGDTEEAELLKSVCFIRQQSTAPDTIEF